MNFVYVFDLISSLPLFITLRFLVNSKLDFLSLVNEADCAVMLMQMVLYFTLFSIDPTNKNWSFSSIIH